MTQMTQMRAVAEQAQISSSPFRPRYQPAQTIFDAFSAEALHRNGRSYEEWSRREIDAVRAAACCYAQANGMVEPTLSQVESSELYAQGSFDYGAPWAYALSKVMQESTKLVTGHITGQAEPGGAQQDARAKDPAPRPRAA